MAKNRSPIAWPVLHSVGGPWGEVAGAVLEAIGLAVTAHALLRTADAGSVVNHAVQST